MASLPVQTFYNKDDSFFALAGSGGGSSSTISTFTTASISSLTVSSINGYDGDVVGGALWSGFPALTNVNMSNFGATNQAYVEGTGVSPFYLNAPGVNDILSFRTSGVERMYINQTLGINANLPFAAPSITTSSVTTSSLTANVFTSVSTINVISTISSVQVQVPVLEGVSSINGLPISSFIGTGGASTISSFETFTTQFLNVSSISSIGDKVDFGASEIVTSGFIGAGGINCFQPSTTVGLNPGVFDADVGAQVQDLSGESAFNLTANSLAVAGPSFTLQHIAGASGASQVGAINMYWAGPGETNGTVEIQDDLGTNTIFQNGALTASTINCSTINGIEFSGAAGGSITVSTISATAISTIGAAIQQGLMSSIVFNPSINPTFDIDMGLGDFGIGLGTGLFAVAVAVPTTVGTLTYGITKGLASLFESKPVNNITNTQQEVFNYQTQLQISTIGHYVSSYNTFLSTIPSTVVINNNPTFSTVNSIDIPIVVSTVSQSANPTCVRSLTDPFQTVSTPWTYVQPLNEYQWVELPATGGSASTMALSTLLLQPSTILKGFDGPGGLLEIYEYGSVSSYGQVAAQAFTMTNGPAQSNGTLYYIEGTDRPGFLDSSLGSHTLAYLTDIPGPTPANPNLVVSTLLSHFWVETGSVSTGNVFASGTIQSASTVSEEVATSSITVREGLNYASANSVIKAGCSINGTAEITFQNQSAGSNASAFFFAVENTGSDYAGFGQNSLNLAPLYNTLFELPGSAVMSGTLDCVIGPQSDHSSNSGIYLTYQDGAFAHHINSNGALSFNASYNGTVSEGDFGSVGKVLVSQGSASEPIWTNNLNVSSINTSSILTVTATVQPYSLGIDTDKAIISGGTWGNILTARVDSGSGTTITSLCPLNAAGSNQNQTLIRMDAEYGTVGIGGIEPASNVNLNVLGKMQVSSIATSSINTESLTAVSTVTTNFFNIVNPYGFGDPEVNFNAYFTLSNGVIRMTTPTPSSNVAMRELLFGDGYLYYQGGNGDFSSGVGEFAGWQWTSMNAADFYMSYVTSNLTLNVANNINTVNVFASGVTSTNTLIADTASISSATISSITAPIHLSQIPQVGTKMAAYVNYDPFAGGYGTTPGQPIISGYFGQTDSSLGGGNGQFTAIFPPGGLSSLVTITGTYFANSSSPGINTPIWMGNITTDANNQISTIQVYGDANRDIFISYIGSV